MEDIHVKADSYGVRYSGELVGPGYHDTVDRTVTWPVAEFAQVGGRITRLRLLTDPGFPFFDVSYCHGTLPSGVIVPVDLGYSQLPRRGTSRFIVEQAIADGYSAKVLGLLDRGNWSILW